MPVGWAEVQQRKKAWPASAALRVRGRNPRLKISWTWPDVPTHYKPPAPSHPSRAQGPNPPWAFYLAKVEAPCVKSPGLRGPTALGVNWRNHVFWARTAPFPTQAFPAVAAHCKPSRPSRPTKLLLICVQSIDGWWLPMAPSGGGARRSWTLKMGVLYLFARRCLMVF